MEIIKIKYLSSEIDKIVKKDNGDWIDLRAAETVEMKAGEFKLIKLGVAMQLPNGYEAHMVPRSSTFKSWGIIQTNHQAVIDESYCGDNDEWRYPAYALRDTVINVNDRICQFRIVEKQPEINFEEVEKIAYETERKLLKNVVLFDVYEGKNLEEGKKSYAINFTLQDAEKTLQDKQIDKVMQNLIKAYETKLGAKIR